MGTGTSGNDGDEELLKDDVKTIVDLQAEIERQRAEIDDQRSKIERLIKENGELREKLQASSEAASNASAKGDETEYDRLRKKSAAQREGKRRRIEARAASNAFFRQPSRARPSVD